MSRRTLCVLVAEMLVHIFHRMRRLCARAANGHREAEKYMHFYVQLRRFLR